MGQNSNFVAEHGLFLGYLLDQVHLYVFVFMSRNLHIQVISTTMMLKTQKALSQLSRVEFGKLYFFKSDLLLECEQFFLSFYHATLTSQTTRWVYK